MKHQSVFVRMGPHGARGMRKAKIKGRLEAANVH